MGLFKSKKWEEDIPKGQEPRCPDGGVVAIWGSPGSGKTVVSVKLAEYLTAKGNNVLLIFSDMESPVLPYVTYEDDIEIERSMGSVLAAAHISSDLIKRNCVITKRNKYLAILGLNRSENSYIYPLYDAELTGELISAARNVAPFVIVDCCSYHLGSHLTKSALAKANARVRVCRCDRKSLSFFDSQENYFKGQDWNYENQILVGNALRSDHSYESIESLMGAMSVKIPYSEEVERQFLEGDLLRRLSARESREFRNAIEKLSMEVFGI